MLMLLKPISVLLTHQVKEGPHLFLKNNTYILKINRNGLMVTVVLLSLLVLIAVVATD